MSGFISLNSTGVEVHTGDPTCDAAHAALLTGLNALGTQFLGPTESLNLAQKGNLGEFISLHIGHAGKFGNTKKFARNALNPLESISGAGVDLMYLYLDPMNQANDLLYIQEVKTTGDKGLGLFNQLTADVRKLFSTNLKVTLGTRIQYISNILEWEHDQPEYAERVLTLASTTPQNCSRVRLVPTGVHDRSSADPVQKLVAVKSSIAALGWSHSHIEPWAIGLSDLDLRLLRLARGTN